MPMKKKHFIATLNILVLFLSIMASCSDKNTTLEGNGLKKKSWSSDKTYSISLGQTLTFTFDAYSNWTAISNSTSFLTLSADSGNSGENTLKITAKNSSQQEGTITIKVNGYPAENNIKFKLSSSIKHDDDEINYAIDEYLKKMYLWNDEYMTLTPDFTLAYDQFLENTLMSMNTNTLDKKLYTNSSGKSSYSLFSFIQKLDPDLQSTRSTTEKKVLEYNFGIVDMLPVKYRKTANSPIYVLLAVQGVYPGSSAYQAGIKRGTEITHINGQILTENNWFDYYYSLRLPSRSMSLEVKDYQEETYNINSGPIYPNPIILSQVKQIGSHKIGYLAYSAFEAGFDEELFEEFKNFHNQSISDLVLDLRYNGGGHVISANLISSCIAGETCAGKTFAAYRYNDSRMKALGNRQPTEQFAYNKYANLNNTSLAAGALNLKTVYCLVSNNTASSSELVINALKGIGIDIKLIGMTTHGKNVGMEGIPISTAAANYELYPITFQSYNAKGYGDYSNGFQPEYIIDENSPNGDNSFEGYGDFGTDNDPLYAKAVNLITGSNLVKSRTRSNNQEVGIPMNKPEVKRIGMIK